MTGIDKDIEQWIRLSDYDFKTAHHMLKSGRYLYILFCCQQALEKRIKSLVVKTTNNFPPRLHDLVKLAKHAGLSLDESRNKFLRLMTNYYIGTRYPEEVNRLSQDVTKNLAKEYFNTTKEIIKWLDQKLK